MDLNTLDDSDSDVAPPSEGEDEVPAGEDGEDFDMVSMGKGEGGAEGDDQSSVGVPSVSGESRRSGGGGSDIQEIERRRKSKAATLFAQHQLNSRSAASKGLAGGGVGDVAPDEPLQTVYVPKDVLELQHALKYRLMMQPKAMPLSVAEEAHCLSLIQSHLIAHGFHRTATALKNTAPKATTSMLPTVADGSAQVNASKKDASIIVTETARQVGLLFDDDSTWPVDNLGQTKVTLPVVDAHTQAQGGTADMLIEKLILDDSSFAVSDRGESVAVDLSSINFSSIFLVTSCCFITPDALFSKLCKLFKTVQQQVGSMSELRKATILKRILNFMIHYTTIGAVDFRKIVCERIASFSLSIVRSGGQGLHYEVVQLASTLLAKAQELLESGHEEAPRPFPSFPVKSVDTVPATVPLDSEIRRVMDVPDEELARQLTLAHFNLFSKIRPRELYNAAWENAPLKTISSNLADFIQFPEEIMMWFASLIVSPPNAEHRKAMYAKTVRVAQNLYDKQNFFLAFTLKGACDHSAVTQLLSPATALTSRENEALHALTSTLESQMTQKKDLLINVNTAHIPHARVYLSQMATAHETQNTFLKNHGEANGNFLINWSKMLTMGRVVLSFVALQSVPYPYQPLPAYQRLIVQKPGKRDRESLEALAQERLGTRR